MSDKKQSTRKLPVFVFDGDHYDQCTTESCPNCGAEVDTVTVGYNVCPECGHIHLACDMCPVTDRRDGKNECFSCANCPWGQCGKKIGSLNTGDLIAIIKDPAEKDDDDDDIFDDLLDDDEREERPERPQKPKIMFRVSWGPGLHILVINNTPITIAVPDTCHVYGFGIDPSKSWNPNNAERIILKPSFVKYEDEELMND